MPKCLVVDDVEVTRFTAQEYLSELGIEVAVAKDGDQALDTLRRSQVDVVLLDWHLKKASGLDLLKNIRKEFPRSLPVIVFSGVEGQAKANEAINAGANSFLEKPTTKEKLAVCLKGLGITVHGI